MAVYHYSQTANTNATADPTVNFAEGQAPSSLNDSARAVMAGIAKYRDDIAGAIVTTGTSTAYAVTSYSVFDTLAHLSGQMIAFTPHTTNGATVTLNVDSLGAKPLRFSPNVDIPSNTLIAGTPYVALYNNSNAEFYLQGVGPSPGIPLGCGMDFWGSTTPGSAFAFPTGQAISRTTYATLFSLVGTAYGSGDGSTTFNLPDKTGRVSAMQEASATRLTSTYFGGNSTTLGAVGGSQSHTLTLGELPTGITSANASQNITVSTTSALATTARSFSNIAVSSGSGSGNIPQGLDAVGNTSSLSGSNSIGVTSNNTSGNPHAIVQPTIICNYIIRII